MISRARVRAHAEGVQCGANSCFKKVALKRSCNWIGLGTLGHGLAHSISLRIICWVLQSHHLSGAYRKVFRSMPGRSTNGT
jgi:hypothetical protein